MKIFKLILVLCMLMLTSCAFNKNFLSPIKFAPDLQKLVTNKTATDSLTILFSGKNHQPSFFDKDMKSIPRPTDIESVVFPSSKNYMLHAYMITQKNVKPKATLIHFHGNGSNLLYQMKFILPLVEKGYQVFIFDYSGFGFSEGKATRMQLLQDGEDAINYVKTRSDVANLPLFIHGMSYGGNLAICVAAKMQNSVDGIVTEGAFSSHDDLASNGNRKKVMTRLFVKEMYASEQYVSQIKKPLLIIHSEDDKTIPIISGDRIFANATADKKQYLRIKGEHLKAGKEDMIKIDEAIMNLLK